MATQKKLYRIARAFAADIPIKGRKETRRVYFTREREGDLHLLSDAKVDELVKNGNLVEMAPGEAAPATSSNPAQSDGG
jgi:hypothetical protein